MLLFLSLIFSVSYSLLASYSQGSTRLDDCVNAIRARPLLDRQRAARKHQTYRGGDSISLQVHFLTSAMAYFSVTMVLVERG
jgi:hypothetical protein